MDRRQFNSAAFSTPVTLVLVPGLAWAGALDRLTEAEASQGLKVALEKGALAAVGLLGRPDGFLGHPKVRIPLPGFLNDAAKLLRGLGQSQRVDELVTAMNRAAEAAVPQARELLVQAARTVQLADAKRILTGGDTSVTDYFAGRTRESLFQRFLPIVARSTETVELAQKYDRVAGKAANMGLLKKEDANLQHYVTQKSLDGLYYVIGEEERKIRQDPVGAGSAVLKKVFGALK